MPEKIRMTKDNFQDAAMTAYQGFCEDHCASEFQNAWDRYQDQFGEIELGTPAEDLVRAAIRFGASAAFDYMFEEIQ